MGYPVQREVFKLQHAKHTLRNGANLHALQQHARVNLHMENDVEQL
jgi:hypothetical protein